MISGTEMAKMNPRSAARVVLRAEEMGGDVANAREVLISAVGETEADRLIAAERRLITE